MDLNSTIVAISSPPGHSNRGVVRCSGGHAFELLNARIPGGLKEIARGIRVIRFRLEDVSVPALLTLTLESRSYTGEDSFELQLPGHPVLLNRVVNCLLEDGFRCGLNVRPAGPGEFTARAFLSGRIGIAEAESVAALVSARSDGEILAAQRMRDNRLGKLSEFVSGILADALALVEAGIDFTDEEDVTAIELDDLRQRISTALGDINQHLQRSIGLESLQSLPLVVLTGPANAGKSTLFNNLIGSDRAVVSGIQGTTRDVLIEPMSLPGVQQTEVLLADIAGDELPASHLDEAMQRAAADAKHNSDLRIACVPPGARPPAPNVGLIRVGTKSDLLAAPRDDVDVSVSVKERRGITELQQIINQRVVDRCFRLSGDAFVLAPRQELALRESARCLGESLTLLDAWSESGTIEAPEIAAGLMREALNSIGEINGVVSPDEILDRVFSAFCIGK